jgi:hypothetical protein
MDRETLLTPVLVIIGLVVLIIILIITLLFSKKKLPNPDSVDMDLEAGDNQGRRHCPLCAAPLKPGQTVKSKVIEIASGSKFKAPVKESISHVFGCPYCYPANLTFIRHCPACKVELEAKDYVIGRYFEKTGQKNHLHVLGCTRCRKT